MCHCHLFALCRHHQEQEERRERENSPRSLDVSTGKIAERPNSNPLRYGKIGSLQRCSRIFMTRHLSRADTRVRLKDATGRDRNACPLAGGGGRRGGAGMAWLAWPRARQVLRARLHSTSSSVAVCPSPLPPLPPIPLVSKTQHT